jgi:hypothetical protein
MTAICIYLDGDCWTVTRDSGFGTQAYRCEILHQTHSRMHAWDLATKQATKESLGVLIAQPQYWKGHE